MLRWLSGSCRPLLLALAWACIAADGSSAQGANQSLDGAFSAVTPRTVQSARRLSTRILFVTNRSVDFDAEARAQAENRILGYEDVFLNKIAVPVTYGWLDVSYPTHRKRGDTNYSTSSTDQNASYEFSIQSHTITNTIDNLMEEIRVAYVAKDNPPLLYVHGFENSFRNAAERLAQIAIDVRPGGVPLLFSWPSDEGLIANLGSAERAYKLAKANAGASLPYAAHAMDILSSSTAKPFNILAHSMGTDLTAKAIQLRDSAGYRALKPMLPRQMQKSPARVIFAAPDIGTSEFDRLRPNIMGAGRFYTVYCSEDYALLTSKSINGSDDRLGYCTTYKNPMDGVEVVVVRGPIKDFARHSYYLSAIQILDDIEDLIAGLPVRSANPSIPGAREIRLK